MKWDPPSKITKTVPAHTFCDCRWVTGNVSKNVPNFMKNHRHTFFRGTKSGSVPSQVWESQSHS